MRIVSGTHKGRIITAPKSLPVRPTKDFAKEALFNILNNAYYFSELSVLDLFSGTGNISYEFASRGSHTIRAVDAHYGCVKFISETAKNFDYPITAIKSDVYTYLSKHSEKADIIFADPPYDFDEAKFAKIAELVFENGLLNPGGVLIIEHSKHSNLENAVRFTRSRKYGGSVFSFFENDLEE
ncbi:MAG: RsmD family RNA methyltransferase [Flavobacteriaceae bacterium]|nr:RsmD family RNA methyltransferase [Flavobacteriaceae bacterium]